MFRDLFLGLWCCLFAAVLCQAPEYFQQYLQRLGGHVDEARRLERQLPTVAERVADLAAGQEALARADALTRPFIFIRHIKTDIAWNTLAAYKPAVPLTPEAGVYALIGILLAVATGRLLSPAPRPVRH